MHDREKEGGKRRGKKKDSTLSLQPFGSHAVVGDSETCAAILSRRRPSLGASHTPPSLDKSGWAEKKKKKNLICKELGIRNNIYLLPPPSKANGFGRLDAMESVWVERGGGGSGPQRWVLSGATLTVGRRHRCSLWRSKRRRRHQPP